MMIVMGREVKAGIKKIPGQLVKCVCVCVCVGGGERRGRRPFFLKTM